MHEHEREEHATEAPASKRKDAADKKSGSVTRNLLVGLLAGLGILLIAGIVVFTVGLYKYGWEGPTTRLMTDAFPFPAAKVNGEAVLYSEYLGDIATLERFFENQAAEGAPTGSIPAYDELRENALERLIFLTVLEQEARKRGVVVTDEEVEAEFAVITSQGGGEDKVLAEIEQLYGWSGKQFKDKVLRSYVLQEKVAQALRSDEAIVAPARTEAEDVLQQLQEGADFAELAAQHSDDTATGFTGGELGFFGRGVMVPEFEAAAFALGVGETSGLVRTDYGFHIIRVDDVEEEDGEVVRVNARHILVMPKNVDAYLQEAVEGADVVRYVRAAP